MDRFNIIFPNREFERWDELYSLVSLAFAFMNGRIDPPSSLESMGVADFREKAKAEDLLTCEVGPVLAGTAFLRTNGRCAYVGKLAVRPDLQGRGLARRMFAAIEDYSRVHGIDRLELQTRVELTENHAAFAALGFRKTGETAHAGYRRPTSITMQKTLT